MSRTRIQVLWILLAAILAVGCTDRANVGNGEAADSAASDASDASDGAMDSQGGGVADADTGSSGADGTSIPDSVDDTLVDSTGPDGGSSVPDVTGTFHFVITPAPVSQNLYLQFVSVQKYTPNPSGGTLDLVLYPLTLDQGSTDGPRRVLKDAAIDLKDVAVDAGGKYSFTLDNLAIPGAANPISGSEIVASVTIAGKITGPDFSCGAVTGEIVQPIAVDLDGQFGSARVDAAAISDPSLLPTGDAIAHDCEGTPYPPDDATTGDSDAGGEPDAELDAGSDTGAAPSCPEMDLTGEYDLQFQTETQSEPTALRMVLSASGGDSCYTGTLESTSNADVVLATLADARLEGGKFVLTYDDYAILPGQSALLPDGGTADLRFETTVYTADTLCGALVYMLKEPFQLESDGEFAAAKINGSAKVSGPGCDGLVMVPSDACPEPDLAGSWDLQFKTAAQSSASFVQMELTPHPVHCYVGDVLSVTNGDVIADVESLLAAPQGGWLLIFRNFQIPPGQSPLLPNGGLADVELTVSTLTGAGMCGDILYKLIEPFETNSEGTFAAVKQASGASIDGHTCGDLNLP